MSLIHDALHKAGNAALGGIENLRGKSSILARSAQPDRRARIRGPWPLMVLVFIGMLSIGSVTALALQSNVTVPTFPGLFERTGIWFRDTIHREQKPSRYVVHGLILGDRSQAIINGEVFGVGDSIGDAVVAEISEASVVLKEGKKEILLAY